VGVLPADLSFNTAKRTGLALPAFALTVILAPVVVFDGSPREADGGGAPFAPGSITTTPDLPFEGAGICLAQGESVSNAFASFPSTP
jgi:hypothetical protein